MLVSFVTIPTLRLAKKMQERNRTNMRNRIAKRFAYQNYDGTDIFRGSIMSIKSGAQLEKDLFFVRYDDGDSEHMEFADVYGTCPIDDRSIDRS